jgi:Family of unknown function (DUF5764)
MAFNVSLKNKKYLIMSAASLKEEIQFAKTHIRNRFSLLILPHISDGIWSVYENARSVCEKNNQKDQILKTFQNLLTRIPTWSEDTLRAEVKRITIASKCSYLEELLTGVLLTYLRAFASVQYRSTRDDVEVEFERPPLPKFIHELYKEVARKSWEYAYLYRTIGVTGEQQAKNRKEIETIINHAVDTVLDSFLPWESIVQTYFSTPSDETPQKPEETRQEKTVKFEEEEEDEEDEEDDEPPKLKVSDEVLTLDIPTLDEPETVDLQVEDEAPSLVLKS